MSSTNEQISGNALQFSLAAPSKNAARSKFQQIHRGWRGIVMGMKDIVAVRWEFY